MAGDGEGLGENTEGVEGDVLVLLGSNVWEGVAVGFLLAKVMWAVASQKEPSPVLTCIPSAHTS